MKFTTESQIDLGTTTWFNSPMSSVITVTEPGRFGWTGVSSEGSGVPVTALNYGTFSYDSNGEVDWDNSASEAYEVRYNNIIQYRTEDGPEGEGEGFEGSLEPWHLEDGSLSTSFLPVYFGWADEIIAGGFNDVLMGYASGDIIRAGGGDDFIHGMHGRDSLYGEDGNDTIRGGHGPDQIFGGNGGDWIWGGIGRNTIDAGAGDNARDDIYVPVDRINNTQYGNPGGANFDPLLNLGAEDKIYIHGEGITNESLTFGATSFGGYDGIGIYANGTLEALVTGGFSAEQVQGMTTGGFFA